ncbi:MAG: DUF2500 domain-containing protein [Oscillospiraceae bacterium]|jgi:hypothetical protein|nr:DUF2500 domain-containing protein [Oscillospiraceae bacterium]
MSKKPFNWVGFCWVAGYFVGLLFFVGGSIGIKINPDGEAANFYGGYGDADILLILGILWLIVGLVLVPVFYKLSAAKSNAKSAFASSPNLSSKVKVISKLAQVTGGRYSTNLFVVAFEFPDGNRKNFPVDMANFSMIVENDIGTLTYKEQGTYLFFVSFQRQT